MLEPPPLAVDALLERVRARFALDVHDAEFLPVGNDSAAWAFRLTSATDALFCKVLSRRPDAGSLEVPRYLAGLGIEHMVPPMPTATGEAFDAGEPFHLVLFPSVEGVRAGEAGLTDALRRDLGRLAREIHDAPVDATLASLLRRERWEPLSLAVAREIAHRVATQAPRDAHERAFVDVWRRHAAEVDDVLRWAPLIAEEAAARPRRDVLCHADFHAWNVLVRPTGGFVVVDWDEALLAPCERDLMFVDGDIGDLDPDGTAFYEGYGDVEIDPLLIAYYRVDWVVQELADYGRRVYEMPDLGEDSRAAAVSFLVEVFAPGGVAETAVKAIAAIGSTVAWEDGPSGR